MKKILINKIYGFLVLGLLSIPQTGLMAASTPALTPTQTAAVMGTITNFILDDEVGTLHHNGTAYGTVTSPYTGRIWLDRNLGASRVCTSFNDANCYGDYYQWGRNWDGHEKYILDNNTNIQATDINNVGHGDFISSTFALNYDWTQADSNGSLRSKNWLSVDGISVCPIGFRVPTINELVEETLSHGVVDRDTAFSNFLKLPSSGFRGDIIGEMVDAGSAGNMWSSSVNRTNSSAISYGLGYANSYLNGSRAYGRTVRCIQSY